LEDFFNSLLERNPAKWRPVCRKIARQTKESRV